MALVLFCDASRIDFGQLRHEFGVPVRLLAIGLPLTIALGAAAAAAVFGPLTIGRGRDPRDRVGPDRRRAWPGSRHRAPGPAADSPGPEHRERTQRRDLRAAALRRRGRGRRGVRDLGRAQRLDPPPGGDRLRRGRRRSGRSADRSDRHPGRPPGPDRARVAPGHPRRRCGSRLRDRGRPPRVGLHRGVRRKGMAFRLALKRDPDRPQRAHRRIGQRARRRDFGLRGHPAGSRAGGADLGARALRGSQPHLVADAAGRNRDGGFAR